MHKNLPKHIVITGASSGIGAALAREYAARGIVLGLLGRNEARLQVVQAACEAEGAQVVLGVMDVTDERAMRQWLETFDAKYPVDLLVANAGISLGSSRTGDAVLEEEEAARQLFKVNVDGMLNSVLPLVPFMVQRGHGQIALMASLAAMRGLPSAPAYSTSKAAVKHYGEALRGKLGKHGVRVSVICPGYVKTPLTEVNRFPMPFLMEADKAARIIRKGLVRNKPRIAFPWMLYVPLWLLSCLSPRLTDRFFAALPEK